MAKNQCFRRKYIPLIKNSFTAIRNFFKRAISNATDATLKLKHLSNIGETKTKINNPIIEVIVTKKKKIHIIDSGIGMTKDEVGKYINDVAFSGAEEFLNKYKDADNDSGIIGHFGLGFYSAFMVAEKVEIITKSQVKNQKLLIGHVMVLPSIPLRTR